MKGSVWERADGRFGAAYPVPVPGGKKRKPTTKRSEEEGWVWVAEMEQVYGGAEPAVVGAQSVGQYLDEWLRDAIEPSVSRSTFAKRAWAVKAHIKPSLGAERLRDLNARPIQSLYARMTCEGYAYSTRREVHVTLKMALTQAFKWSLVRRNECEIADAPRDILRPDPKRRCATSPTSRRGTSSAQRWTTGTIESHCLSLHDDGAHAAKAPIPGRR